MTVDDLGDRIFCDVPEVARIIGRDERTIRESIKSGQIPGTQIGKQYAVPTAWLRGLADVQHATQKDAASPDVDQLADLVADRLFARFARMLAPLADAGAGV